MTPSLSVIITSHNEIEQTRATVQSIRDTAGSEPEIIVIDDGSPVPVVERDAIVHRNIVRLGVGRSRHIGATMAQSDYLLLTDCHMRFEPGWFEAALKRIVGRPKTLHNGTCLGLTETNMNLSQYSGEYEGATLCLFDPKTKEILEGKWIANRAGEDDYELACLMGAVYFVPKAFFLELRGLRALRMWGSDEPYLSLKAWLAGGEIRALKTVRVGHMFREKAPYVTYVPHLYYNKLWALHTVLPSALANFLTEQFPKTPEVAVARSWLEKEWGVVTEHREYFRHLFVRSAQWYFEKFNIAVPDLGPQPVDGDDQIAMIEP